MRMMKTLLSDVLGEHVFAYLDGVIIHNKDPKSHFQVLEVVLLRDQEVGLKAKLTSVNS